MSEPRPEMVRPYLSDPRIGDGYRNAFILARKRSTALLFIQTELVTVTVPLASLAKAKPLAYRPAYVRERILARVALYRRQGWRFPRTATIELLRRLGARKSLISETVNTPPLPEVLALRARRDERAAHAAELADAITAIRSRIELQAAEAPACAPRPRRRRRHEPHRGQLALAL
jgi:hypothetical protein